MQFLLSFTAFLCLVSVALSMPVTPVTTVKPLPVIAKVATPIKPLVAQAKVVQVGATKPMLCPKTTQHRNAAGKCV